MTNEVVVARLNELLYERNKEEKHCFSWITNGYCESILFDDYILWNSEDDGRQFIEKNNNYESMLPYIKKQFNLYIEEITKLKF